MTKKFLLTFLFLTLTFFGYSRIIYVSSTTGSDSRTLTQALNSSTPWATLSKVQSSMSQLTAKDSILFQRGGRYGGTLNMFNKNDIYFGTYGTGPKPLFWGTGAVINSLVTLTTCRNIVFDNWNVSDTTISFSDRTVQAKLKIVFTIQTSSTGVVIKNVTMDRIGYGVYITSTSRGQRIESCDIGNLRMIKNTPRTINADDDYGGVPIQISSRNNVITNNYFHDCWAVSYDYGFDGGGIEFFEEGDTISGNQIMYNTFYDNNGTLEHGSNNDGIARHPIQNNTFAYNKVIDCSSLVYINNNGQYKTRVKNLMIHNNILVQRAASRTGSTRILSMAISDTTVNIINLRNNAIRITNRASVAKSTVFTGPQLTHTNNVYQLGSGSVLNFTLTPTELVTTLSIWTDTTASNPLNWNYMPAVGSPLIKKGISLGYTKDFSNFSVTNPPDIGILQFRTTIASFSKPSSDPVVVRNLYYIIGIRSIYIDCTRNGVLSVANQSGSYRKNYPFKKEGHLIYLGWLPSGLTFASTFGKYVAFLP